MNENKNTDEAILASISDLFLTYGLRSTSMDDISSHLKISKKTLYQIFKNKNDVVEQVIFYRLRARDKQEAIERIENVSPVLYLFEMKKHILEDLNTLLPSNFFDLKKYHPEVFRKLKERNNSFLKKLLKDLVHKGIKDGIFRKDLNTDIQVFLLIRQFTVLKNSEREIVMEFPLDQLISTIIDNFIISLSTEKGLREFEELNGRKEK